MTMEKIKPMKGRCPGEGMVFVILYWEVREGLSDNMTFEQIKNNFQVTLEMIREG